MPLYHVLSALERTNHQQTGTMSQNKQTSLLLNYKCQIFCCSDRKLINTVFQNPNLCAASNRHYAESHPSWLLILCSFPAQTPFKSLQSKYSLHLQIPTLSSFSSLWQSTPILYPQNCAVSYDCCFITVKYVSVSLCTEDVHADSLCLIFLCTHDAWQMYTLRTQGGVHSKAAKVWLRKPPQLNKDDFSFNLQLVLH